MEIGIKNQIFLEKAVVGIFIPINWFGSSCSDIFFAGTKLTLHKHQVHRLCHAVMSLQFTHVSSFACRGVLWKSRVDCSTVGLYRVTIPWQQTCKSSCYITVAGVLLPETVERKHLGRLCREYGGPFVKILYLTDLAQKLLSLRTFSYLCAEIAISARI